MKNSTIKPLSTIICTMFENLGGTSPAPPLPTPNYI